MNKLNQKNIDLDEFKGKAIKHLLDEQKKLGFLQRDAEYQVAYERLSKATKENILVSKPREQTGKTDVEEYNDFLQDLYIDLLTVFEQTNAVSSTISNHKKLNNSVVNNLKTRLSELDDQITILEDAAFNSESPLVYVENFRSTDSFERDSSMYSDEYGNPVPEALHVGYDKYNECLRLPMLVSINKLVAGGGESMATISIRKQIGDGLASIKNPHNLLEKAIDTDDESYWEETILTDAPLRVKMDKERYYQTGFGAMCELELVFNHMTTVNEINFLPYGEFPLDIIAIRGYKTDNPDNEEEEEIRENGNLDKFEIVSPNRNDINLRSAMVDNSISYQFQATTVKRLRIILNQQHYIKDSIVYDKNEKDKNEIWFSNDEEVIPHAPRFMDKTYKDKALTSKSWFMLNNTIQKQGELDIEEVLFPKESELIPTSKYEYNYGLYNLGIFENNYRDVGVYVSKRIETDFNIGSVKVEVDSKRALPHHQIKCFISPSNSDRDWIEVQPGQSVSFRNSFMGGSLPLSTSSEEFYNARSGFVKLKNAPHYDADSSPNPISLVITDKDGHSNTAINVTDYRNPGKSYNNFDRGSDEVQFYFHRNKVFFDRRLDQDSIVRAEYKHLINGVRFKAVLRRSTHGDSGMTPILNGYRLTFKEM